MTFPLGWIVGADMARRATGRLATAILAAITLAGCAFAPGATDPAAAHQRAQAVLSAWADAVEAAGASAAVTPVGELTGQIGDWEEAVGDNNKRALMGGMVLTDSPLSDETPPDGESDLAGWVDDAGAPRVGAGGPRPDQEDGSSVLLRLHHAPGDGRATDVRVDPDLTRSGDRADLGVHGAGHRGRVQPRP